MGRKFPFDFSLKKTFGCHFSSCREITGKDSLFARSLEARFQEIAEKMFESNFQIERVNRYGIDGAANVDRQEMQQAFIEPLLRLLIEYLYTGDEVFLNLYLDERLRYAPHRASQEVRKRFFKELLQEDEAILSEDVAMEPDTAVAMRTRLNEIHLSLLLDPNANSLRVLAVGDCLMNEIRVFLPSHCRRVGIEVDMRCLYFSAGVGKKLSAEQIIDFIAKTQIDLIAMSFLTYEGLPLYRSLIRQAHALSKEEISSRINGLLAVMRKLVEDLRAHTEAPILLHNVSGLPLMRWRKHLRFLPPFSMAQRMVLCELNRRISELAEHTQNCILLDEDNIARENDYRRSQASAVPESIASGALFHTSRFGSFLAKVYTDVLRSYKDLRKTKVLLLDFDNTLWDGVMADGAVQQHDDRQHLLRRLRECGILLVAVSKNDPKSIRWSEMVLTPEDFVAQKISWKPKASSILEVASELDLGLNSFILIDDSPEERGMVSSQLPLVHTLDSHDPYTWQSLHRLLQFPNTKQTEEARSRTSLYRAQALRREALNPELDYTAMMASLGLCATVGLAQQKDLPRLAELVQRTNQFNTTTIRYPKAQLQSLIDNPTYRIYVAELSDKFGSLGLVAAVIIELRNDVAIFESFVMSCRAMGFGLEHLLMNHILAQLNQVNCFVGRYIPTDRNSPAMFVFSEAGFRPEGEHECIFERGTPLPPRPAWFTTRARASK